MSDLTALTETASSPETLPGAPPPAPAGGSPNKERRFQKTEALFLLLGLTLFLGSGLVYLSGISLRKVFLGWDDEEGHRRIGALGTNAGLTLRQFHNGSEFGPIKESSVLYNMDTVMTNESSQASLVLDDGAKIELSENTLVKLIFDPRAMARIEVMSGSVSASAGAQGLILRDRDQEVQIKDKNIGKLNRVKPKPAPIPVPTLAQTPVPVPTPVVPVARAASADQIQMIYPRKTDNIFLDDASGSLSKKVKLAWKVKGGDSSNQISVTYQPFSPQGGYSRVKPVEVFSQLVTSQNGNGQVEVAVDKPGVYRWELKDQNGKTLAKSARSTSSATSEFKLSNEIRAIDVLPPLYGGTDVKDNRFKGQKLTSFDVTFRWKSKLTFKQFNVQISDRPDLSKVLLERSVNIPSYSFNKDKVLSGKLYYKVTAPLPKGFKAVSAIESFGFAFLPPILVSPKSETKVSRQSLEGKDDSLLMTWQKTNFTLGYDFQLAAEGSFARVLIERRTTENFFLLKALKPGRYYWRARSISATSKSDFSQANSFIVTP